MCNIDCDEQLLCDGEDYLAGFLARCFKEKYPYLGDQYTQCDSPPEWAKTRFIFGTNGLYVPSTQWREEFQKLEAVFKQMNPGDTIDSNLNFQERLQKSAQIAVPTVPEEVVKKWALTRIKIRIRRINKIICKERSIRKSKNKIQKFCKSK